MLEKKAAGPLSTRLLQVLVNDPEPLMFHAEPVYREGKTVGYVRRRLLRLHARWRGRPRDGGGRRAGQPRLVDAAEWEVDIAGRIYPATASLRPLYDPQMLKVKA